MRQEVFEDYYGTGDVHESNLAESHGKNVWELNDPWFSEKHPDDTKLAGLGRSNQADNDS